MEENEGSCQIGTGLAICDFEKKKIVSIREVCWLIALNLIISRKGEKLGRIKNRSLLLKINQETWWPYFLFLIYFVFWIIIKNILEQISSIGNC